MKMSYSLYCAIAAFSLFLVSCKTKDQFAGADGDFVDGMPLPERTDGASYLGGGVNKGQFSPVQFGLDSVEVSG